jgi:hypothetical protein
VVETHDIVRPPAELSAALAAIGGATASAELSRMGIRSAFIRGPVSVTPGVCVAGPALTLQFLPKREDLYPVDEYAEPEKQLHRHVMYHTQPGDMIVVGLWIRGATPNFHVQTGIVPTAVNVPVACGGTLVEPGDIVVVVDDGRSWCRSSSHPSCWPSLRNTRNGRTSPGSGWPRAATCGCTTRCRNRPGPSTSGDPPTGLPAGHDLRHGQDRVPQG